MTGATVRQGRADPDNTDAGRGGGTESGSLLLQGALSHSPGVPFMQLSQKAQPRLGGVEGVGGDGGGGGHPVVSYSGSLALSFYEIFSCVRSLALSSLSLATSPTHSPPPYHLLKPADRKSVV